MGAVVCVNENEQWEESVSCGGTSKAYSGEHNTVLVSLLFSQDPAGVWSGWLNSIYELFAGFDFTICFFLFV